MSNYRIIYRAFPEPLRGSVFGLTSRGNNSYTVLVDASLSDSKRKETLKHELSHILLGHLEDDKKPVDVIEREAEQYAATMTDEDLERLIQYGKKS